MARESLTMLQLANFPADGSIITGLLNCVYLKKTNDEDTQVFKFLNELALLKSFQDWTRLYIIYLLGN